MADVTVAAGNADFVTLSEATKNSVLYKIFTIKAKKKGMVNVDVVYTKGTEAGLTGYFMVKGKHTGVISILPYISTVAAAMSLGSNLSFTLDASTAFPAAGAEAISTGKRLQIRIGENDDEAYLVMRITGAADWTGTGSLTIYATPETDLIDT